TAGRAAELLHARRSGTFGGTAATRAPPEPVPQTVDPTRGGVNSDPETARERAGMSATADIQIQQIENAILVPSRAVQTSGTSRSVTVLQGAQRVPVTVQVETGASSNGQTQILSCVETGAQCLRPGDLLSIPATSTSTTT